MALRFNQLKRLENGENNETSRKRLTLFFSTFLNEQRGAAREPRRSTRRRKREREDDCETEEVEHEHKSMN